MSIHMDFESFIFLLVFYLLGFFLALIAPFQARTPQGAMAWILALIFIPFLAIPAFIFFGKKKLEDYDLPSSATDPPSSPFFQETFLLRYKMSQNGTKRYFLDPTHRLTTGHSLKLLLGGRETFAEMIQFITQAKHTILLQVYIFRTDRIGSVFAHHLMKKAQEGVKVFVLYERLGIRMSKKILHKMKLAGVSLGEFSPLHLTQWRMNFKNHKKLLIVDGKTAFFGGVNIGDDYLGRYPEIGQWRDTNVRVEGPTIKLAQDSFIKDWNFSQKKKITLPAGEISLKKNSFEGTSRVYLLNTSPSRERSLNLIQHLELIHSSQRRIWIANPYVVPPEAILDALLLVRMKGVDVRVLVPHKGDNRFVTLAMTIYLEKLALGGVRVFRFSPGMMHQKVILIDDDLAVIGSSNLDYRSMYINFENLIMTDDQSFIKELNLALRSDFDQSTEMTEEDFKKMPLKDKLLSRLAHTTAPVL